MIDLAPFLGLDNKRSHQPFLRVATFDYLLNNLRWILGLHWSHLDYRLLDLDLIKL